MPPRCPPAAAIPSPGPLGWRDRGARVLGGASGKWGTGRGKKEISERAADSYINRFGQFFLSRVVCGVNFLF
jgi:hypothetical protein